MLRVRELGEADRLVTLLSPEEGKVAAVARGARRATASLAASVQVFTHLRLVLWRGRTLDGIRLAEVVDAHRDLMADLGLMTAASYCCELAEAFATERQEAGTAFTHLAEALAGLERQGRDGRVAELLRWFDLHLLSDAGYAPALAACAVCGAPIAEPEGRLAFSAQEGGLVCPGCAGTTSQPLWLSTNAVRALRHLAEVDLARAERVRVGPRTMREMDRALMAQIQGILQRPLKTRALLDSLS